VSNGFCLAPGVVQDPAVQELVSRNVHSIKQLQMKRQEEAAKQG
jgi:hypothetical protein